VKRGQGRYHGLTKWAKLPKSIAATGGCNQREHRSGTTRNRSMPNPDLFSKPEESQSFRLPACTGQPPAFPGSHPANSAVRPPGHAGDGRPVAPRQCPSPGL